MTEKSKNHVSLPLVLVGLVLFLFGSGLDLTIVGAPEGLSVQVVGVVLILAGLGRKVF